MMIIVSILGFSIALVVISMAIGYLLNKFGGEKTHSFMLKLHKIIMEHPQASILYKALFDISDKIDKKK